MATNIASQVTMSTTGTVSGFSSAKLIDGIFDNNVYVAFGNGSKLIIDLLSPKNVTEIRLYGTTGWSGLGWIVYDTVYYGSGSSHNGPSNPIIIPVNKVLPTLEIIFDYAVTGNSNQQLSEIQIFASDVETITPPQNQAMSCGT